MDFDFLKKIKFNHDLNRNELNLNIYNVFNKFVAI